VQLENPKLVTKFMSEINFMSVVKQGDIVEIGIDVAKFGKSSVVLKSVVRDIMTRETIITIDNITMVNLGEDEKPYPHGKTLMDL
jgi:acyl-CoA thioesterase YciA